MTVLLLRLLTKTLKVRISSNVRILSIIPIIFDTFSSRIATVSDKFLMMPNLNYLGIPSPY